MNFLLQSMVIELSLCRTFPKCFKDPDPLDPQDFGFLDPDPDPQKYADPRIRIQGAKYQPKTAKKKILLSKPKSELFKKERL